MTTPAQTRAAARLRALEAAELAYLLDARWTTRRGRWFPPKGSPLSSVAPGGWTVGCAVANQRNLDEPDPEPEPPPPTPEHAAKVREQVRQIIARPGRKADRKVGR